jgi:3-hydroxyacyl-[acyl-carrier-protein] dehydratase
MTLNIEQITKIVPQRFPFLLIDRVIELSEERIVAIKNLSINESFFQGHFPDNKIMPGTLLVECAAQAAIILFDYRNNKNSYTISGNSQKISGHSRPNYYLGSIKAKFIKAATVGDILIIEITPVKLLSNAGIVKGGIFIGQDKIAQVELGISVK